MTGLKSKILSGAVILAGGQFMGQMCAFVRNIIIARLISPEDFGIAATFVITVTLFEMISNLSVDRLLVQAKDGNDPGFQATAHLFQAVRGLVNGLLVLLLAWPVSQLFGVPEAQWAFQWLALVPILRGFAHLDVKRLHRELRFKRDMTVDVFSQVILVSLAWPLGWWLGDYRAMLWLLITQAVLGTVMTHLLAKRSYRWGFDRQHILSMCRFGWPLMFNGMLLFLTSQDDRALVGVTLSLHELGVYSATSLVLVMTVNMVLKIVGQLGLPLLAVSESDPEAFRRKYEPMVTMLACMLILGLLPFVLAGSKIIGMVYGAGYEPSAIFVTVFAIAQAFRGLRGIPTLAAMARGDTKTIALSNLVRGLALIPAAPILIVTRSVESFAVALAIGELAALVFALVRASSLHSLRFRQVFGVAMLATIVFIVCSFLASFVMPSMPSTGVILAALIGCSGIAAIVLSDDVCRTEILQRLGRFGLS